MVYLLRHLDVAQRLSLEEDRAHAAQGEKILSHLQTACYPPARLRIQESGPLQDIPCLLWLVDPEQHLSVRLDEVHVGDVVMLPDFGKNRPRRREQLVPVAGGKRLQQHIQPVEAGVRPGESFGVRRKYRVEHAPIIFSLILQPFAQLVQLEPVSKKSRHGDTDRAKRDD